MAGKNWVRKDRVDAILKKDVKYYDSVLEFIIDCDNFFGKESLINLKIKKQISIYIKWQLDKKREQQAERIRSK